MTRSSTKFRVLVATTFLMLRDASKKKKVALATRCFFRFVLSYICNFLPKAVPLFIAREFAGKVVDTKRNATS